MRKLLFIVVLLFAIACHGQYGTRFWGYGVNGSPFGYSQTTSVFNPIDLNPLQWLNDVNSPLTILDKTDNGINANVVDSSVLKFDSAGEYVALDDTINWRGDFSFSLNLKCIDAAQNGNIISHANGEGFRTAAGKVLFTLAGVGNYYHDTVMASNQWYNLRAVKVGTNLTVSVDAVTNSFVTVDTTFAQASYLSSPTAGKEIHAYMSDIVFTNGDTAAKSFSYSVAEGDGLALYDRTDNINDAVITGATWDVQDATPQNHWEGFSLYNDIDALHILVCGQSNARGGDATTTNTNEPASWADNTNAYYHYPEYIGVASNGSLDYYLAPPTNGATELAYSYPSTVSLVHTLSTNYAEKVYSTAIVKGGKGIANWYAVTETNTPYLDVYQAVVTNTISEWAGCPAVNAVVLFGHENNYTDTEATYRTKLDLLVTDVRGYYGATVPIVLVGLGDVFIHPENYVGLASNQWLSASTDGVNSACKSLSYEDQYVQFVSTEDCEYYAQAGVGYLHYTRNYQVLLGIKIASAFEALIADRMRIAYDDGGDPIARTPPAGWVFQSDCDASATNRIHNGSESAFQIDSGDAELLVNGFWSANGSTYDKKYVDDFYTHHVNFSNNVTVVATGITDVSDVITFNHSWTQTQYNNQTNWLSEEGSTLPNLPYGDL